MYSIEFEMCNTGKDELFSVKFFGTDLWFICFENQLVATEFNVIRDVCLHSVRVRTQLDTRELHSPRGQRLWPKRK